MEKADSLRYIFPESLRGVFGQAAGEYENLEEIRLRANRPVILKLRGKEVFLRADGGFADAGQDVLCMDSGGLMQILNCICHDSVYAYEDEIRMGFLTVRGGHRIGVVGQVVVEEDGRVRTMKHIAGMNIRVAHEMKGVADPVLPYLCDGGNLHSTLLISPPGCGKTTLLRDIIRQVSNGGRWTPGMTVGVVDERSEIAGCYLGVPQNDVGIRTDVLDACPKVYGMMMLIRSMAPDVVAIDEMGSGADFDAMRQVSACGCRILATVHGTDMPEASKKEHLGKMMRDGFFSRYIVMDKRGGRPRVAGIYDREGMPCASWPDFSASCSGA